MENNSQSIGGENLPSAGEAIFSTAPVTPEAEQAERFVPNNAQSIGAAALEGMPLPDAPSPDSEVSPEVAQLISQGGEISAEEQLGDTRLTSDGLKKVREDNQRAAGAQLAQEEYKSAEETYQKDRDKVLVALGHYGMGGDA